VKAGFLGISGVSNDMKEIEKRATSGDKRCKLAIEMFAYRIKKYIGAYAAVMGGINTLVFSAGIGEGSPSIRAMICDGLEFLGIQLEERENRDSRRYERIISTPDSKVQVLVIPVNEEEIIVMDTISRCRSGVLNGNIDPPLSPIIKLYPGNVSIVWQRSGPCL